MKTLEFSTYFPDEASCKLHFRECREQQGLKCPKCGSNQMKWSGKNEWWECSPHRHRTSLRVGTVMENSHLPFLYWYKAMHFMSCRKEGISALALQEELGHKRYEPIWLMLHKLRSIMGKRDELYQIAGTFELDEGFFEHVIMDKQERERVEAEGVKRGRGSEEKSKVLVMVGSKPVEEYNPKKHDKNRKCGFLKMKVIKDLKAATIQEKVVENVDSQAEVETDDSTSYTDLGKLLKGHTIHDLSCETAQVALPWVHTAISNAKRKLLGTYYMVADKYIQNYLNEFAYMFNRKYFKDKKFHRVVIAALTCRHCFSRQKLICEN